jgi:hypothetical protein
VTTETLSTFFAFLSLACWAATLLTLALVAWSRARPDGTGAVWLSDLRSAALWAGWVVATVTTLGSLYYSQVAHFVPCELCWFQRICVYPLTIVLLVAAIARDRHVWRYVVGPAAVGLAIAAYHTQLQAYPDQRSFCSTLVPCSTRYVWEFGFVSLPFMALAAFGFILVMVLVARTGAAVDQPGEPR